MYLFFVVDGLGGGFLVCCVVFAGFLVPFVWVFVVFNGF